jgi:hypothetical protein
VSGRSSLVTQEHGRSPRIALGAPPFVTFPAGRGREWPVPRSRRPWSLLALVPFVAGVLAVAATSPPPAAAALDARWSRSVAGARFEWSSPALADINGDGNNDVVVGGSGNNRLYVFNGVNGSELWSADVGGQVNSSPAVGDVDGDGTFEIVTGFGAAVPSAGGIRIFETNGATQCVYSAPPRSDGLAGVFNSPAIGDVNGDGVSDVVFGSFNDKIYAVTGGCGVIAQFDNTDTVWSAPALRNVDNDPEQEIFIGGDATASAVGLAHSGGYYRSLEYAGTSTLRQRWQRLSSEAFQGSSAFATLDGKLAVVTNNGADYCRRTGDGGRCGDSQKVWAFDPHTGADIPGWPKSATYTTFLAGPATGDINGDGLDDVVVGSTQYSGGNPVNGAVDAFLSGGGRWTFKPPSPDEVTSPPVIADVNGSGTAEVIVGTLGQLWVLNGPNGAVLDQGTAAGNWAHKNAVAVGVVGGGWSVVTAGFDPSSGAGKVGAFSISTPGPAGTPWPMFQKNARRLGSGPTDTAPARCESGGYWLVASDGGIFSFGPEAPFFGSAGNIRLNQPIVGMTARPDRTGYWFVARDGGIFTYGSSQFFGSTGAIRLNQPIVGMAARPQGDGYWLVAADGGIFAFGNAAFHGSTGAMRLNQPIVGMAATPSGNGYWLVARDGGIFTFGDARFHGSTGAIRLNKPIVGMTPSPTGNGYWFVASDGGIFSFGDSEFLGSTGALVLNQPIVGMRTTSTGNGYWLVATDGGIFSFGDATFCGSTGNIRLNQPIVGMG